MTQFRSTTYQNEYLAQGATQVTAVVAVCSSGGDGALPSEAAEVIIVDMSGSMGHPRVKAEAARSATGVAIDRLRDGVWFGVIAGSDRGRPVYPYEALVRASATTRAEAKAAVAALRPEGGTAIGSWLSLARGWLVPHEGAVRHALLLTDGRNEGESRVELDSALDECTGVFQCDCRGVGTDWEVKEMRHVADRLLGEVAMIAAPEQMAADFDAIVRRSMGKRIPDVRLRVQCPRGASLSVVKQVDPDIADLFAHAVRLDEQTVEFPTGAWGDEEREYQISISVKAGEVGDEMLAGRVSLVVDDEVLSTSNIVAIWTDDTGLSTRLNGRVAVRTGQADYATAVNEGLEARRDGDVEAATRLLGAAVQHALRIGDNAALEQLSAVVVIEDANTGTVRLRPRVDRKDEMMLEASSTKTVRVRGSG